MNTYTIENGQMIESDVPAVVLARRYERRTSIVDRAADAGVKLDMSDAEIAVIDANGAGR